MQATRKQVEEFTKAPLLGILATVNPKGAPRAMAVYYDYDGEAFYITSYADLFKVRNIRQNPEVCLVIVDTVRYGDMLTVSGKAHLIEEGIYDVYQRLNIRYLGEERGRVSRERYSQLQPRIVIRITPVRMHYRRSMESPPRPSSTQDDTMG